LIFDGVLSTSHNQFDNPWSAEKTFKKLEASGILAECLRCMTVPQQAFRDVDAHNDRVANMVKALVSCPSLLQKKFKKGEPCGDVVCAILEGKDGHRHTPPTVIKLLKGLVHSVQSIDSAGNNSWSRCGYCGKIEESETPLMKCARCKRWYYCSKECQRGMLLVLALSCHLYHSTIVFPS